MVTRTSFYGDSTAYEEISSASASAVAAAASAAAALVSEAAADVSEAAADVSEAAAAASAAAAAASASAASTSASTATAQASAASTSASTATTQASNASSSASAASTSASTATTQASASSASAVAAAASAAAAAISADNFDDRYLGAFASDPTLDNDGNALTTGALYFNSAINALKIRSSVATWLPYSPTAGILEVAEDTTPTLGGNLDGGGFNITNVTIAKALVGLGNVDNTTDTNKPVSTAQQTALDLKANLAGPTFTGVPAAPTAAPGTNTTQVATTAYADAIAALKADLASPTFTGVPAAPTAAANTNTTQIATTAYVQTELTDLANGVSASFDTLAEIATDLGLKNVKTANLSDVASAATAFGNIKQAASTTATGVTELAVASEFRANTAGNLSLTPAEVWSSAAEVTLTDAATIAVDMSTFLNAVVTLTTNRALGNPTNEKVGQSGVIRVVQPAGGGCTLSYGTDWEFAGGTAPVLSTAANAQDLLFYHVVAADRVYATLTKAIA